MFRARIVLALLVVVTLMSFAAPAMAAPPPLSPANWGSPNCTGYYTVQPGDNLYRIAMRFSTSVPAIMLLNGLTNPNYVWAGQRLCVSGSRANPYVSFYVVAPGDTLYSIAARHGVSVWLLARVNGIWNTSYIRVGQTLIIPDMNYLH